MNLYRILNAGVKDHYLGAADLMTNRPLVKSQDV
jgi:hypothetical protein